MAKENVKALHETEEDLTPRTKSHKAPTLADSLGQETRNKAEQIIRNTNDAFGYWMDLYVSIVEQCETASDRMIHTILSQYDVTVKGLTITHRFASVATSNAMNTMLSSLGREHTHD